MKFMSYNSTSTLSDYTIGIAYAFYVHNDRVSQLDNADYETVRKHAPAIAAIESDNNECTAVDGRWLAFTRVSGVVVDKHEATETQNINYIKVMFKTASDNYVLDDYAVGIHDVFTNGKDDVLPATVLSL